MGQTLYFVCRQHFALLNVLFLVLKRYLFFPKVSLTLNVLLLAQANSQRKLNNFRGPFPSWSLHEASHPGRFPPPFLSSWCFHSLLQHSCINPNNLPEFTVNELRYARFQSFALLMRIVIERPFWSTIQQHLRPQGAPDSIAPALSTNESPSILSSLPFTAVGSDIPQCNEGPCSITSSPKLYIIKCSQVIRNSSFQLLLGCSKRVVAHI